MTTRSATPPTAGTTATAADADPQETREWLESLDAVLDQLGAERARFLVSQLLDRAATHRAAPASLVGSPYHNTVAADRQPAYPGDVALEDRIERLLRWNAAVMVSRANVRFDGVGGHIATYASLATVLEVAFNHFFQGKGGEGEERPSDQVFFQGHAAPGIYARAWLEGRLGEDQLDHFRRESGRAPGLPSYPHPWLLPDFWEFPTVSMGLAALGAIYQARFNRYLLNRGLHDTSKDRVWAFLGDGEMDEPESTGVLSIAARERLDNLTFVVNCNLQRLDGPVRGNTQVIQELEGLFRGAGWNVVKCVWSSQWDPLFAADADGRLLARLSATCDGDWQRYSTEDGAFLRQNLFGADPELLQRVAHLSDAQLEQLGRGGMDRRKVYAALRAAVDHTGAPSVVLVKTVKGYGIDALEGVNPTHQIKKLAEADLKRLRDRCQLPISDRELVDPPLYKPADDAPELVYLRQRRTELGGPVPQRKVAARPLEVPALSSLDRFLAAPKREVSTTGVFGQLVAHLMKDPVLGPRIVPIIPDEGRTFGMEGLFTTHGIYNPDGQRYTPPDAGKLTAYVEKVNGQVLQEGINEAGAMGSFCAAGTSYATHGEPMIPFYIFYSMFGFQRTGDQWWAFGDMRGRGFLLGATAGRTTLNGEGLQHEDGHSLLLASAVPNLRVYDPAFGYEVAVIIQDGLQRMLADREDVFYYLTLYNENLPMPAMPDQAAAGVIDGLYRYQPAPGSEGPRAQVLGSGPILRQALLAQSLLAERYGVRADVWSATSYAQLRREALEVERWNRLNPTESPRTPRVAQILDAAGSETARGPVIAVSDYMAAVPDQIARWVPGLLSLGTDGFGRSDTRDALRRHFEIDAASIAFAVLSALSRRGEVKPKVVAQAAVDLDIDPDKRNPARA